MEYSYQMALKIRPLCNSTMYSNFREIRDAPNFGSGLLQVGRFSAILFYKIGFFVAISLGFFTLTKFIYVLNDKK